MLFNNIVDLFKLNEHDKKEVYKIFNKLNNHLYFIYEFINIVKNFNPISYYLEIYNYYNNEFKKQYEDLNENIISRFKQENKQAGLTLVFENGQYKPLCLNLSVLASVCALDLNDVELNENDKLKIYAFIIGFIKKLNPAALCCLGLWYDDEVLYLDISTLIKFDKNELIKQNDLIKDELINELKFNNEYFKQIDSGILSNDENEKYKISYTSFKDLKTIV